MLVALVATSGFTTPSLPRLARRRDVLSGAASCLTLGSLPFRAAARVDGIPLYAPQGSAPLPTVGFEKLYPALERLIEQMVALRDAVSGGEWTKVAEAESEAAVGIHAARANPGLST